MNAGIHFFAGRRMAKIDKNAVKALARENNIAYYSAKMVLKEKWTMDYAKSLERPVFNQGVRWLLTAKKKKYVMAFRTFDKGVVLGKVLKVRKYNNLVLCRGRLRYIEKIDTAFIYNSRIHRLLPEYVKRDPFVSDVKEKPAYKPSERKQADLAVVKEQQPVRITLYTGEIFEGVVHWATEFDFELKLDRYVSILVLRHAVVDALPKEDFRFRQPVREQTDKKPFHSDRGNFKKGPRPAGPRPAGPRPAGPRPPGQRFGFGPTGFGPQ
jgi:sRNA-binding regulator protein Hfq